MRSLFRPGWAERAQSCAIPRVLFVSLSALAFGCANGSGGTEQTSVSRQAVTAPVSATLTLSAPHQLSATAPVLEAADSIGIGPQAIITGTTVALGTGPQGVNAGPQVIMNDTWSRGGVNLGPLLQLNGTLHASTVTADPTAVVTASDRNPVFDPVSTLSWGVTFPATLSTGNHTLNGQSSSLAPGGYSSLSVDAGGTVTLHSGTYYLTNLTVASGATVSLDQANGPVIVYVSSALSVNATFKSLAGGAPNLLVGYLGTSAVTVGATGAPFNGALIAPFTQLSLLVASTPHTGFFAARDISVGSTAKVQYALPVAVASVASPTVADTSLPRALPTPPAHAGCYAGTLNGWVSVPCENTQQVATQFPKPDVDMGIKSSGTAPTVPIVFGQVETMITTTASEADVVDPVRAGNQGCDAGGPDSGFAPPNADQWSVQNNSNFFKCDKTGPNPNGAFECVVQFTIQSVGTGSFQTPAGTTAICITNANGGTSDCDPNDGDKSYNETCVGLVGENLVVPPDFATTTRQGPLKAFDFANIAGSVFTDTSTSPPTPMVAMVAQFSWSATSTNPVVQAAQVNQVPGLYAIVAQDTYGLANQWTTVTGGLLGKGGTSMASFKSTGIVTRVLASSCPGDTAATGPLCSTPALQPNAVSTPNVTTAEQNNLTLVSGSPAISFPNKDLAVTEFLSSTNDDGSCSGINAGYAYVKDNAGDNGGLPSNSGNLAFWESPDIFILPHTTVPTRPNINDVSPDTVVTPGQTYDIYVRVNNDGCGPVNGLQALIYIADPDVGLTQWQPVTSTYLSDPFPADSTIQQYSRQILGPYPWMAPQKSAGHKCLLAAIQSSTQRGPAPPLPLAYTSNQVAQRNIEFSATTCVYNVSNTTNANAFLQLGVTVSPASAVPTKFVIMITDSNAATLSAWASAWQAQAPSNLSVAQGTDPKGQPMLSLTFSGTSQIALNSVTLPPGDSPAVQVMLDPAIGTPPTVAVSATLTDVIGNVLSANGTACVGAAAAVVK